MLLNRPFARVTHQHTHQHTPTTTTTTGNNRLAHNDGRPSRTNICPCRWPVCLWFSPHFWAHPQAAPAPMLAHFHLARRLNLKIRFAGRLAGGPEIKPEGSDKGRRQQNGRAQHASATTHNHQRQRFMLDQNHLGALLTGWKTNPRIGR